MKNLIWIVVAILVVGGGYMLFTGQSPADLVGTTDPAGQAAQ